MLKSVILLVGGLKKKAVCIFELSPSLGFLSMEED